MASLQHNSVKGIIASKLMFQLGNQKKSYKVIRQHFPVAQFKGVHEQKRQKIYPKVQLLLIFLMAKIVDYGARSRSRYREAIVAYVA